MKASYFTNGLIVSRKRQNLIGAGWQLLKNILYALIGVMTGFQKIPKE